MTARNVQELVFVSFAFISGDSKIQQISINHHFTREKKID